MFLIALAVIVPLANATRLISFSLPMTAVTAAFAEIPATPLLIALPWTVTATDVDNAMAVSRYLSVVVATDTAAVRSA